MLLEPKGFLAPSGRMVRMVPIDTYRCLGNRDRSTVGGVPTFTLSRVRWLDKGLIVEKRVSLNMGSTTKHYCLSLCVSAHHCKVSYGFSLASFPGVVNSLYWATPLAASELYLNSITAQWKLADV